VVSTGHLEITDFNSEQLRLMNNFSVIEIDERQLPEESMLHRKNLMEIFGQLTNSNMTSETHRHFMYDSDSDIDDFCNGGDDYGYNYRPSSRSRYNELVEYTTFTAAKTFSITMYNRNYYRFWLNQIVSLPESVYEYIFKFIVF